MQASLDHCFQRWAAHESQTECSAPDAFELERLTWFIGDPDEVGDTDGHGRARLTGELLEIAISVASGNGSESGWGESAYRLRTSTCEGVSATIHAMARDFAYDVRIRAGGQPALGERLYAALNLEPGDPNRAEHDLSSFATRGPHAVYQTYGDIWPSGDGPDRCFTDGPCLGPAYEVPPWRPGPPLAGGGVFDGKLVSAEGLQPGVLVENDRWTVLVGSLGRFGHIGVFAIYDKAWDRSRWVAVDYGGPVSYDDDAEGSPPTRPLVVRDGYLGFRRRLVDLEGRRAFLTWPHVTDENFDAFVAAAKAGRCDVDCEPSEEPE